MVSDERVRFNPFSPDFRDNPYETYARIRRQPTLLRTFGVWILTRYQDIVAVARDRKFSSSVIPDLLRRYSVNDPEGGDLVDCFAHKAIVFTDNPDHARLRKLVHDSFSQAAIELEREDIQNIVSSHLARSRELEQFDLMAELAGPIPLDVACRRLGISTDMQSSVAAWTHHIRFLLDPSMMRPDDYQRVRTSLGEFFGYLKDLLEFRKLAPGDDLLSKLLRARAGEEQLTDAEVLVMAVVSFVAGHETTKYLLGNTARLLVDHPDQSAWIRKDPTLAREAVLETLRYDAPLQQTKRVCTEDTELRGEVIRKGEQLLLCLGAGNHDPDKFTEPERFDIRRSDKRHLGFGFGMRACLGAPLAELEAEAFVRGLLAPGELEPLESKPEWQEHSLILRGLSRYLVRWKRKP